MNLGLSEGEVAQFSFNLARAIAIIVVGLIAARLVRSWIMRLGLSKRIPVNLAALLGNLAQVAIVVFAMVLVLPTFGVDWTGLLTVIGTIGLAISLAFQDLLKNIIAGIYILIERPFQIGDLILVGRDRAVAGTVQSIELRVTTLRTEDGLQVIVPNSVIFSEVVTNRSAFNLQRDVISVSVPLGDHSVSSLSTAITGVLEKLPDVCKSPAPSTRVETLAHDSVKLQVEFWTPPAAETRTAGAAALALREALPAAEVTVIS